MTPLVPPTPQKLHYYPQPLITIIPNFTIKPPSHKSSLLLVSSSSSNSPVIDKKKRHFKAGEYPPPSSNGNTNLNSSSNRNNGRGNREDNGTRNRDNYSSRSRDSSRNWEDNSSKNRDNNGSRNRDNGRNWEDNNGSRNRDNNSSRNRDSSRDWEDNNGSRNRDNNGRNRDSSRKWEDNNGSRNRDNRSGYWEGNGRNKDRDNVYPAATPTRSHVRDGGNSKIKNINKKMDRRNNAKAWVSTVTESLSDLIIKKQWLNALEVFDMLKEQPFYQPKEGTYMKLIVLLGRCGQPQRAKQLFDTMLEEGLEPTPQLYTALLSAYCRSNLINQAFALLDKMKSLPLCQPDVYTYSILIKACVDACQFDLVEKLYVEMSERSIVPNTVTQNTVLSGYGKAGKFDQMEKVLSGMLGSTSSEPDVWTMNTILGLFGNKGQIETMEKWYEKFRNFGIEPETRTFNILIGAYGKKRMYDKMSSVMEYMRKLSFPWTTSTYNNVIEAFSDSGDAKHMEHTFEQMRAEGIKADTKTFCCLIRGYANAGLFHKVISSAQLAGELEIPENTSFYNAIVFACAKAEDLVEMERVFQQMKDRHCKPDSTTYDAMIDVYRSQGMSDKVYDLEQEREKTMTVFGKHSPQVDEDSDLET